MDFLKSAAQQYSQSQQSNNDNNHNQGQNNNNNNQGQGNQNDLGGMMGALNNALGSSQNKQGSEPNSQAGGLMNLVNGALGGGEKGEAKEDKLDKAIDMFQEHVLKAGQQNSETALEQAKDKQIAEAIRGGYKQFTGKDIPS